VVLAPADVNQVSAHQQQRRATVRGAVVSRTLPGV
jgi:hypothetical protein